MKKPEKSEPVMEFVFQTIKLEQVKDLIPVSYRSKYEAIRSKVIEKIKSMPEDETFIFQPQDQKARLNDNLIARICHGINTGLVRESLNWKISFSNKARAFVVAPFKRYKLAKRGEYKVTKQPVAAATSGGGSADISEEEAAHLTNLIKLTHQHFGKNLKDLQTKLKPYDDPELANLKKAFIYVGHNAMGIRLSQLGKIFGLKDSSGASMCRRAMINPKAKEYVKVLSEAISTNGGGN